jgi:hypothetical protein
MGAVAPASPFKQARRQPIPEKIKTILWGRAAGRCQYAGCNALLIGDQISGAANASKAYIGHIVADSPDGPRGDPVLSAQLAQDPDNLMLVCDAHHRIFDRELVAEHTVEVLRTMKRQHETRIRIVTDIDHDRGSHVIRYAARIGTNESPVAEGDLKSSMLPHSYPIYGGWIDLDLATLDLPDHEPEYWPTHIRNLRSGFNERIRGRMERGEIRRLTVFALAPIPLLIELGRLLSDISAAQVRQLLRNPKGWKWDTQSAPVHFSLVRSHRASAAAVALKLEISASIVDERATNVLGMDTAIWSISAADAHNDIVRRPEDVAAFAKLFRRTLDDIKVVHGENATVHVFPAVPVSIAVEAGRSWQPKAHPSLAIYDQNRKLNGFALAHRLEHAS